MFIFKDKFFWVIILIALFLRFYKLDSYPLSLSWDEVAIGYNAFSISETGADEYGRKWPILFKSFNDYKLPGYIYIDSIVIKLFGVNEFAVRFPSALFGAIAVVSVYFLIKELFNGLNWNLDLKNLGRRKTKSTIGVHHAASFLLAISPWHLHLSRAAFEANLALTIFLIGLTFLIYGLKNKVLGLLALPFLSLSIYFYYSPRILVPAMIIVFIIFYRKEIIKNLQYFLLGLIISFAMIIPIAFQIFSVEGLKRVKEVSIFQDQSKIQDFVLARNNNQNLISSVFLNWRNPLAFETLHNYFSHFSPGFLFFGGDPNPRHHSAFHGNFYIFEILTILIGIWALIKLKDRKIKYFILAWLLIAPIPASFTQETPHSLRSLLILPPLVILSAIGAYTFVKKINLAVLTIVLSISIVNYFYSYYLVYPIKNNLSWAYGHKQMLLNVSGIENQYDRIIITGHYWKPHIFHLFYNKIDPQLAQTANQLSIGKYRFGTTNWDNGQDLTDKEIENLKSGRTVVVISPQEYDNLKDKKKFMTFDVIKDYSKRSDIFLIGEWQ